MNPRFRSAIIAALIVVLDRVTKIYIQHNFSAYDVTPVIPGIFNIVHAENPGAAFSMLADASPLIRKLVLIGLSAAETIVVGFLLWKPATLYAIFGGSSAHEKEVGDGAGFAAQEKNGNVEPQPHSGATPRGSMHWGFAHWGLTLVFGGALGNLIDRIFRGTVTDFLQVFLGSYEFPSFNVADSAITIGAGLLIIDLLRNRKTGS